jgi:hypothetical protein
VPDFRQTGELIAGRVGPDGLGSSDVIALYSIAPSFSTAETAGA